MKWPDSDKPKYLSILNIGLITITFELPCYIFWDKDDVVGKKGQTGILEFEVFFVAKLWINH